MISLKTADSALKNVYLDVINNQLNNNLDPFYAKIEKTTKDIVGNEVKKLITIGVNGGVGAGGEDGALPIARESNYACLTSKLKNLYGSIEITDKALRASQSENGAFLNLLNAEMDNLIEASKYNLRYMIYGDGTNNLGATDDTIEDDTVVYKVSNIGKFVVGMRVNGYDDDGELVDYLSDVEVLSVDYDASTITLPASCKFVEDDWVTPFTFKLANNTGAGIFGLSGVMNTLKYPAIYGLNRAGNSFLVPYSTDMHKDSFGFDTVLKIIDDAKIMNNGNIDMVLCGMKLRRLYQSVLKRFSFNADITQLEGGVKSITVNGIPVVASRFIADGMGYFVDSSTFKMHQLCDWTWLANDKGEILKQKQGYAVHTATLVKYCDMICDRPSKNAVCRVTGL